jgi:hypothetical protein
MFFAVPVCACFYSAVNLFTESRLKKKNLPTEMFVYGKGQVKAEVAEEEQKPPLEP